MLVLTRFVDESVVIRTPNGEVVGRIQVVVIKGDRVRLAFDFPPDVIIWREEIDNPSPKKITTQGE